MKIACIATYPPKRCGIGTFTANLVKHIYHLKDDDHLESVIDVIALNDNIPMEDYPSEVKFTISQQVLQDYYKAADYVNFSDARICILQHEFGIFGGESGVHILRLVHRLHVPFIVTMHTVLEAPSFLQKSIIQEFGRKADRLVVMSNLGVKLLNEIYKIPLEKITLIEHGVPDFDIKNKIALKEKFNLEKRKIILTFGLLGRNKGIEVILHALPKVIKKYPEVVFLVLGKTHPNVAETSGESYRQYLQLIVREKDLENHVIFINKFVPENTLLEYLASTDIYITPYLNEAQITSGTLSYAIGAGAACLSTPYWHAKELLSDGRGRLFDFNDHNQLEKIILELLDNPKTLKDIRKKAYKYGKQIRWPNIGQRYLNLASEVVRNHRQPKPVEKSEINLTLIPVLNLSHFKRLTDGTGILQHAKYGIPNLKEGYCLDDNARALLAALSIYTRTKEPEIKDLIPVYFSYLHYMQKPDGTFRNFLSFDRQFLDDQGSEDSFGRAIWALGYLIRYSPNDAYHQLALEIFEKAYHNFEKLSSIRGISNTLIGLAHYIHHFESDERAIRLMESMRKKLVDQYVANQTEEWHWFENILTYDNGVMPLALYHSWQIVQDSNVLAVADESMQFLENTTMKVGHFRPVGSDGWYPKDGECAHFAQQATDTMIMILLFFKAYQIKKRNKDLKHLFQCFTWFLGENDLRLPLYDHETNGCCDGLESYGVNRNQGAESTMAYLISNMTVLNAVELESEIKQRGLFPNRITEKSKDFLEPV